MCCSICLPCCENKPSLFGKLGLSCLQDVIFAMAWPVLVCKHGRQGWMMPGRQCSGAVQVVVAWPVQLVGCAVLGNQYLFEQTVTV